MSGAFASGMDCVPIPEARRLARETGATRLLILGIDDHGNFAFTTFGRTRAQCAAMGRWADRAAPSIALMMKVETDR